MEKRYYQKEIETMPVDEIKALQTEKLIKQVKNVYENVEYYRNLMDKKGVKPEDIKSLEDISKLPFLTKDDLREGYPYGLLGTDIKNVVRIQSTSGTTGKRVVAFYTQNDIDIWEECCARAIVAVGGTEDDVCHVCYGYGLFTGGMGLNGGSHKVGCMTLPMSSGNTDRQIQFMMDLGSTILCCTPSYAAYIGESLAEYGYKPEDNKLKAGIFGAEPWTEEMRQEIEKMQNAGKVDNSQKANKSQQSKQDKENDDASSLVRTDKATGALVPPVINGENSAPAATDSTAKNMTSTDEVSRMLNDAAQKYGVDNRLVDAIAQVESGKNQKAVSPAGAIGVMQLMVLDSLCLKQLENLE